MNYLSYLVCGTFVIGTIGRSHTIHQTNDLSPVQMFQPLCLWNIRLICMMLENQHSIIIRE